MLANKAIHIRESFQAVETVGLLWSYTSCNLWLCWLMSFLKDVKGVSF